MRFRRRLLPLFSALLLVTVGLIVLVAWFLQPNRQSPDRVDVVVVLAGVADERHELGTELVEAGIAENFVVSAPIGPTNYSREIFCRGEKRPEGARSWCIDPEPSTTAGEALAFNDLAREQGWETTVVITHSPHAQRAKTIFADCTDTEVTALSTDPPATQSVLYLIVRETGGLVKHWITEPCAE